MPASIVLFFRKSYKILGIFIFLIAFFAVYNTYLVDRSLINLRAALDEVTGAQNLEDLNKIKLLIKSPILKELFNKTISSKLLLSMETAENIAVTANSLEQAQDVKFLLEEVIKAKEKERGAFLSFLDRLNSAIFKAKTAVSKERLESQARVLSTRIASLKDSRLLQEAYYALGNIYLQLFDLPRTEEAYLKAIAIDPQVELAVKSRFNLAWAYKNNGDYEKAISLFEELVKQIPELKLAVTSKYEIADALYKKGEYFASRDRYAQLAKEAPDLETSALALLQAGMISLYKLEDFKSALKFLNEFALFQAGYISFSNLDDLDSTLKYFSKLQDEVPTSEITKHLNRKTRPLIAKDFRNAGYKLLKEEKYPEAIDSFRKALEISPIDARSIVGIGVAYYRLKNTIEALYYARKAVSTEQRDEIVLINASYIFINSGTLDEAIAIGEEILPKTKLTVRHPELYYNLGTAYIYQGKMNEAATYFNRAIRLNKEFIFSYNNLGCAAWALKDYAQAIRRFQEAIAREPSYVEAHFNLAIAYFYLSRFLEAYREFEKVLDINPGYADVQKYLNRIKDLLKYTP